MMLWVSNDVGGVYLCWGVWWCCGCLVVLGVSNNVGGVYLCWGVYGVDGVEVSIG